MATALEKIRPPAWVLFWLFFNSFIVLWDAGYCLNRPRSMPGGDLHWIWQPYGLYGTIDLIYGQFAVDNRMGFTSAQAVMNLIEVALNFLCVYAFVSHRSIEWKAVGFVSGLVAVVMTWSKTTLYFLQDHFSGMLYSGHNDWSTFVSLYVVPNGVWIVVPLCCIVYFAGAIRGILAEGIAAQAGETREKKKE